MSDGVGTAPGFRSPCFLRRLGVQSESHGHPDGHLILEENARAPPEAGSLGISEGDRVTVLDFLESDRQQGIMVRVKNHQRVYRCPIFRLRPVPADASQGQPLLDYRAWFHTVGLPEIEESEE